MRPSSSIRLIAAATALMLAGAVPALAQSDGANANAANSTMSGLKLSGDKPIQIESDKLEVRQEDNVAVFTGNVSVVQGPTLLKAGSMKVFYAKDGGSAATGSANIDHLEVDNKVYIKSDTQVATGDRGTFDMKSQVLVLSGSKVVLSEGPNVLVGCKLTVQMKTGLAQVDGCAKAGSGGRVMMSITPGSQKP
ncbi:LptA/OstA family protein [Mesorhizobium sp. BE184]|uniref:LptA/OstA family protein n=1 Tax=Mesorhizobium sp. BE184 TaxID=2817714 RepID=UPI0028565165|nr:LptA/OstA family protein [Mesorhizobium sp. BE184]MDR7034435.1 lipopolysaccharide export system protein LptA [Mesorhizobium sp. BE184]